MYYNILVDFRYVGTLSQVVLLKVQLVRLLVCLSADALVSLFHFSLVGEVEEGEGEAGGHQEHHVKPPKAKLIKIAYYNSVLLMHNNMGGGRG